MLIYLDVGCFLILTIIARKLLKLDYLNIEFDISGISLISTRKNLNQIINSLTVLS